jgi:hypothetical protein
MTRQRLLLKRLDHLSRPKRLINDNSKGFVYEFSVLLGGQGHYGGVWQ